MSSGRDRILNLEDCLAGVERDDCCCNAGLCSRVWKRGSDLRQI